MAKEEAPAACMKPKAYFEVDKVPKINKILELSDSQRKSLKVLRFLVEEALNNHELSTSTSKVKVETLPQQVSIWGVPLMKDDRTDVILLKFLKARNFNISESFKMLKNTIRWRMKFNIDGLMEQLDTIADLPKVVYVNGQDKEGHLVWYNMYGDFQNKDLYINTFGDEAKRMNFVRKIIQMLERSIWELDFSVGGVSSVLMIIDLNNSPGPDEKEIKIACNQLHQLLQDHYPEFVEKQNLPIQYGGLNGAHLHNQNPEFTVDDAAIEIEIKPLTNQTVEIFLDQKCIISWEIRVLEWGVSYDAEFAPDFEGAYPIVIHKRKKKMYSDEAVVSCNKFKVGEPGKILLTIDNVTSKGKRFMYRFKVSPIKG